MKTERILLAALLILVGTACSRNSGKAPLSTPTTGQVTLMADESFRAPVEALIQVFNGIYPYATVNCEFHSTDEVIHSLLGSRVQMVFASRRLTREETDYFHSRKLFPHEFIFARDGVAIIANPAIRDSLLSLDQLRGMLNGSIATWGNLGYENGRDSLRIVFDNTDSGTIRYMLDSVCRDSRFGPSVRSLKSSREVVDFVAANRDAIGIIGSALITDSRNPASLNLLKRVKVFSISRTSPARPESAFPPYQAYLANLSYPLTRNLYIINAEPRNGLASGVTSFVCSDRGQRILEKTGIAPVAEPARNVIITN